MSCTERNSCPDHRAPTTRRPAVDRNGSRAPSFAYLGGLRLRLTIFRLIPGPNPPMNVSARPRPRPRHLVARMSDPLSSTASVRHTRPAGRCNRRRAPISAALGGLRLRRTISRYLCLPNPPMNVSTSLDGRPRYPSAGWFMPHGSSLSCARIRRARRKNRDS